MPKAAWRRPEAHIRPIEPTPIRWRRILAYDLKLNLAMPKMFINVVYTFLRLSSPQHGGDKRPSDSSCGSPRRVTSSYSGQHARLVLGTSDRRLWRRSCDLG